MSSVIYMSVEGKKQGLISQSASTVESIGNKYQAGHEDEIFICSVSAPLRWDENVHTDPISITKMIDRTTPLLSSALNDGEKLTCNIFFHRHSGQSFYEPYFKIKLYNAFIIHQNITMSGSSGNNDSLSDREILLLGYNTISHEHLKANTSSMVYWRNQAYQKD